MSQPQQNSPTGEGFDSASIVTEVWVLRESFLAYERFHGVFASKEAAQRAPSVKGFTWAPIKSRRKLPPYMWDDNDPFDSSERAESTEAVGSLWVVEPRRVEP